MNTIKLMGFNLIELLSNEYFPQTNMLQDYKTTRIQASEVFTAKIWKESGGHNNRYAF